MKEEKHVSKENVGAKLVYAMIEYEAAKSQKVRKWREKKTKQNTETARQRNTSIAVN